MARKISEDDVHEFMAKIGVVLSIVALLLFLLAGIIFLIVVVFYNPLEALLLTGTFALICVVFFLDMIIVWFWNKFIADE